MKSVEERTEIAAMYGMSYEQYDRMTDGIATIFNTVRDSLHIKQSEVYTLIEKTAQDKKEAAMMATALVIMCRQHPDETDEGKIREYCWTAQGC